MNKPSKYTANQAQRWIEKHPYFFQLWKDSGLLCWENVDGIMTKLTIQQKTETMWEICNEANPIAQLWAHQYPSVQALINSGKIEQ